MAKKTWTARNLTVAVASFLLAGVQAAGCSIDDGGLAAVPSSVVSDASTLDTGVRSDAASPEAGSDAGSDSGPVDFCKTSDGGSPCQHGGTCANGATTYSCSCPAGYGGTNCENTIDNCASNPCVHGTCTNVTPSYTCACATGFQGANCDACATDYYAYPTCVSCTAATTCNGHGTCAPTTGLCTCNTGFAGTGCASCATNYYAFPTCTFCDPALTCSSHGTCSTTGTCTCATNYSGAACGTFTGAYAGSAVMPSNNNSTDTVPQYGQVNGTAAFDTNTANNRMTPGVATTLTKLTLSVSVAPDIGNRTWTGTIMKNGTATTLTCQIATNGTTCNVSMNVALASTDAINIQVVQSNNTGTNRTANWTVDYTQP